MTTTDTSSADIRTDATRRTRTGPAALPAAAARGPDPHDRRRWWILGVVGVAQLMVVLDATIVNIALPSAQRDLGFSSDQRQWVITAYALAFGSLLLLGGRLADLFGRKTMFLVGIAGFAAASAVGGAASGFGMLVAARATQGMFGALLAPAGLALLTTTFTDARGRARAFGVYGAIAGTGGAVGLLLGGVLTEYLDWRWCMYVNLVFAALALVGGVALLRRRTTSTDRPKIDLPGTITASAGLFSVVYGFSNAETQSWGATATWGFLLAGAVLLALFVVLQTRVAHPLLPMRVLLDRNRAGAYLTILLVGGGMFGMFLFLTYYLQQNLGFSPVSTGLAFLPMVGALMVTATVGSTVLLPRVGPRPMVVVGMLVAAAVMFGLTNLDVGSTYAADVLPATVLIGLGMGLVMAPSMSTATGGVQPRDAGVASAMVNTSQQVGGSIGTALLSTIAASAATNFAHGKPHTADVLAAAAIHSYTTVFGWVAAIFAVGAVVCGLLIRPGVPTTSGTTTAAAHI